MYFVFLSCKISMNNFGDGINRLVVENAILVKIAKKKVSSKTPIFIRLCSYWVLVMLYHRHISMKRYKSRLIVHKIIKQCFLFWKRHYTQWHLLSKDSGNPGKSLSWKNNLKLHNSAGMLLDLFLTYICT
jgi:hypothetical protein